MPSLRLSCGAPALRQVCSVRGTLRFALRAGVRTVLASVFVWLTTMAASTVSCSARDGSRATLQCRRFILCAACSLERSSSRPARRLSSHCLTTPRRSSAGMAEADSGV